MLGVVFFFFLHRKMMEHKPGETRKQFESKALSLNYSPISPPVLFLEGSDEITMLLLRAVALAFGPCGARRGQLFLSFPVMQS